jgi:hypothetical protein
MRSTAHSLRICADRHESYSPLVAIHDPKWGPQLQNGEVSARKSAHPAPLPAASLGEFAVHIGHLVDG